MKMRKILPIVVLAVGALFLLSGCDAMLDAIFSNSQITVDVKIYYADYPLDWGQTYTYGRTSGYVDLYLYDVSTSSLLSTTRLTWSSADLAYIYYPTTNYTDLKNDTYQVYAYYYSYYDGGTWYQTRTVSPHDAAGHSATVNLVF